MSTETWVSVESTLLGWSRIGREDQVNGTRLIGRVPHVGSLAWLHTIYRGLSAEALSELEETLGVSLPVEYREFLSFSNGLNVFSDTLALFGSPPSRARMGLSSREPYDLALETLHTREIPGLLCFGAIGDDFLYFRRSIESREIISCPKGRVNQPTRQWRGFWEMLGEEVARLAIEFDKYGRRKSG